jgi:hypothetical protein
MTDTAPSQHSELADTQNWLAEAQSAWDAVGIPSGSGPVVVSEQLLVDWALDYGSNLLDALRQPPAAQMARERKAKREKPDAT